jgi:hypothetical protein
MGEIEQRGINDYGIIHILGGGWNCKPLAQVYLFVLVSRLK